MHHLNICSRWWLLSLLAMQLVSYLVFASNTTDDSSAGTEQNKNTNRPNILLILADDIGTGDVPFFWDKMSTSRVDMPNIFEKLAKKGVLFTDAHSSPKCAPSRYMVLSGNYPHRGTKHYGTWNVDSDGNQFRPNQKSIAEALQNAGYETGAFGKWHLGGKIPPNGIQTESLADVITNEGHDWSLPLIQGPGHIGFDRSYISLGGIQSPPFSFFRDDYLTTLPEDAFYWEGGPHESPLGFGTSKIPNFKPGEGDKNWDCAAYDMILVNETEAFIDNHMENRSQDPFFAYVALGAVHDPHSPPDFYMDGSQVRGKYETEHLDMLGAMDKAVGSLVSLIESKGLADNTIIVFTSDNGGLRDRSAEVGHRVSGPLRGAKATIFEGGHRVPLIFRYDGEFPVEKRRKKIVGLNDIYATLLELAGVDMPTGAAQDSVSFAEYIKWPKKKQGLRKYLGSWHLYGPWSHAIRKGNLKLIHFPRNNTFEMYNLKKDVSESKNIVHLKWVEAKKTKMFEKLKAIGPCPDKDSTSTFAISGVGEYHDCAWFQQDNTRCELYFEGELNCASICGRFHEKCRKKKMHGYN